MLIPTDEFGLISLLVLIVPGVIFMWVKSSFNGYTAEDRSVPARILQALVVSVVFDSIYFAFLGAQVQDALSDPAAWASKTGLALGLMFFLLGIAVPALVAWLLFGHPPFLNKPRELWKKARPYLTNSRFGGEPTAWDNAATTIEAEWVRVRLPDGEWIGGKFTNQTYFSTYPEPRDLFIHEQYSVDEYGNFGEKVPGTAGVWLAISDDCIVQWVYRDTEQGEQEEHDGNQGSERRAVWRAWIPRAWRSSRVKS